MFWAVSSGGRIPVCSRNWTSVSMNCCFGLPRLLPHVDRLRAFHTGKMGRIHMLHRWDMGFFLEMCTSLCAFWLLACFSVEFLRFLSPAFLHGYSLVTLRKLPPLLGVLQTSPRFVFCKMVFTGRQWMQCDNICFSKWQQHLLFWEEIFSQSLLKCSFRRQ